MSKEVVIFEDGKSRRGSRAKLIRRGNKRILIEFWNWGEDYEEAVLVQEWFKLYIPSYVRCKKAYKHNNKRNFASYYHKASNEFYSDYCQTDAYKDEMRECWTEEYHNSLFGDNP